MTKPRPQQRADVEQQIRDHAARLAQQAPDHLTPDQALLIRKVFTPDLPEHAA